ncbi:hypothetical protein D9613_003612 [Agrocybe pediades]|uniref:F-box domain-containing protein n=1 Tax=Agrocybe pediades TaxID=84607 RepID=A0A8H4QJU6_9AGAR|nr:hypothetical protein D9613_003612 [Agrocybe pediades]
MPVFLELGEDMLIYVLSFLEPPDILRFSQSCRFLNDLCSLRIVWTNVCTSHVMSKGYPFPSAPLESLSVKDLKRHAIRACSLGRRWLSGISEPRRTYYISGTSGTSVSDARFLPGRDGKLLMSISKSVWSALSIWNITVGGEKLCEWSPRGAIFTGFAVNSAERSEATIAVSLQLDETHIIKMLQLKCDSSTGRHSFGEIYSFESGMIPITLDGDLLALADVVSKAAIWNWRTGRYALLEHAIDNHSSLQSNDCMQIVFAHESVLVVRARAIHLYAFPTLEPPRTGEDQPRAHQPIAHHSFGWVDGESVAICPFIYNSSSSKNAWLPLSILVRGESDDPWASDIHNLELYTLEPNPSYSKEPESGTESSSTASPYLFPPQLTNRVPCLRGSLRCKQVVLGRFGTAVWIQPRDRFIGGLLADIAVNLVPSSNAHESLVLTAFPGSLNPGTGAKAGKQTTAVVVGRKIYENEFNTSWTSFDYDEVGGRIVLGSSFGRVTVLYI